MSLYNSFSQKKENTEFHPYSINGFLILRKFDTNGAGTAEWTICQKNGIEFFIKRFLSPKFINESEGVSPEEKRMSDKICMQWFTEKEKVQQKILLANHGNIVIPLQMFRFGNYYYLVTQKIDICDKNITNIYALSFDKVMIILKVLAHELTGLEEQGVIHGDLKPDNIMIKETIKGYYTPKIIDYDNSFLQNAIPSPDLIGGDQCYMSPETIWYINQEVGEITPKADVFSMGIIFYQILTGGDYPEFDNSGGEISYVGEAVLNGKSLSFSDRVDKRLTYLIRYMLVQDPKKRIDAKGVFEYLCGMESNADLSKFGHPDTYFESQNPEEIFGKIKEINNIPQEVEEDLSFDEVKFGD